MEGEVSVVGPRAVSTETQQAQLRRAVETAARSRAKSTRRVYEIAWRQFTDWCAERGLSHLPADGTTVAVWLGDAAEGAMETLVEVGGEGGSIRLVGVEDPRGWAFKVVTQESGLLDDEDDWQAPERPWVRCWDEALAQLDEYPWTVLHPLAVDPRFAAKVVEAVERRGASEEHRARWLLLVAQAACTPGD